MNFSEWGRYDEEKANDVLIEICRQTRKGNMPLPSYRRMHGGATLTAVEVDRICVWTKEVRRSLSE
jgi:Haem-binding domain